MKRRIKINLSMVIQMVLKIKNRKEKLQKKEKIKKIRKRMRKNSVQGARSVSKRKDQEIDQMIERKINLDQEIEKVGDLRMLLVKDHQKEEIGQEKDPEINVIVLEITLEISVTDHETGEEADQRIEGEDHEIGGPEVAVVEEIQETE